MASIVQLKRSALSGKVPDTGSLNLGELAVNTYDGKIYFKKSGSIESIESVVTTNSVVTGSIRLEGTGSFGSLKVNDTLTVNHGVSVISGSLGITSDLTVLGQINARQFNISIISSSTLFESGSSNFGNSFDDTHTFTGSVNITGSFLLNGQEVGGGTTSGSFTGSFTGDGSGLRGVVSDDLPIDGWDYNSNSSASISEFNNESRKYLIDFQWDSEVGTPVGFKTFISNVTGSSQIVPTEAGIKFIVGNQQVALVGPNGIESVPPAGTVSGSSQLTSSYDTRYVLSGSITQTTWDNIASKPNGIISGSQQITNFGFATTGSNTLKGDQTISGSIIPSDSNVFDLGSPTNIWRDLYISSGSIKMYDGNGILLSNITATSINANTASINQLNSFTSSQLTQNSSLATITGSLITTASTNVVSIINLNTTTASLNTSVTSLNTFSSSQLTQNSDLSIITGSLITTASNLIQRVGAIESVTSSYARTNSSNTFNGQQVISGSLWVTSDLIVQGSSSIQNITASNLTIGASIVTLNTATPIQRFAGLQIVDSGSSGGSGSFLYDAVHDEFIFVHRGNGTNVTSSHFVLGPETIDNLGNETYLSNNRLVKGTGKEHLNDSNITDDGTTISLGSNVTITGSITISGNVDGVDVSVLNSNINSFSSSALTRLSALEVAESNLESFTSSINTTIKTRLNAETVISGSSQVDVMSTTNIARLATTGSNTFNGNQTINSTRTSGANVNSIVISDNVTGVQTAGFGARIQYLSNSNQVNAVIGLENGGTGTNNESQISFYTQNTANALTRQVLISSAGNTTFTGTITENSSIRYKENVETIKYGLDKVLQMRGVTYNKKDNGVKEMGVIAEEIYDVLPEVILKTEEGEIDSVSYGRITAVLIEAIKDLKKEIEELKANR